MSAYEPTMIRDGHLGGYLHGGDPATWCPQLWTWLIERYGIQSVLDVGCGEGHSTRHFADLGCEVLGVDGCRQALIDGVIPDRVVLHDFCDGPFEPGRGFDMVWSCEFLEHISSRYVPHVMAALSSATKIIAVTHAFPGQEDGHHHVNCQPGRYWIEKIESLGFRCAVHSTLQARKTTLGDHMWVNHFARSGLLFVDRQLLQQWPKDQSKALWSAAMKSLWIRSAFKLSGDYWTHRQRRHAWKRQQRRGGRGRT